MIEPKGHVTPLQFEATLAAAVGAGFARGTGALPPSKLEAVLRAA